MRFSATRIQTWMDCSLQAKYKYIDRLESPQNAKASFGTCIHHALEIYNQTGDNELAKATFTDVWHHPEKLGVAPDVWPRYTTYSGLRDRGLQILDSHHEKLSWDDRQVLGTEHRFLVPIGDHELTGAIDLLDIRRSGRGKNVLRVTDYKTSTKKPTQAELALNIQMTTYVYATYQPEFWLGNGPEFPPIAHGAELWEELADMPRRAIWYALWTNTEIDAGARDDEDFLRMYRALDEIEKAIEREVFVPDISGSTCTFCAFVADPCPFTVIPPRREEIAEEEDAWL